jgi:hypothetical protein
VSQPQPIAHRNVTLLRVATPAVLDEIRALVNVDDFVLARVDDVTLIVDPARTGELAEVLKGAGLPPLVHKHRPSPRVPGTENADDGDTLEMPGRR